MRFGEGVHLCDVGECSPERDDECGVAVETHWRIVGKQSLVWPVCESCISESKRMDDEYLDMHDDRAQRVVRFLYLPVVQPIMGSEAAIAMEVAMLAATRLLRICKLNDGKPVEREEAAESLALLRAAQAAAWERVHGKEAA